jgi:hypothetical protein
VVHPTKIVTLRSPRMTIVHESPVRASQPDVRKIGGSPMATVSFTTIVTELPIGAFSGGHVTCSSANASVQL